MNADVIVRAQGGDRGAFNTLATQCAGRMFALAVGILRDRSLAEDAVQQALIDIWRDLPRLREPDRFDAWSYRLLVRVCHAEARKRRRRQVEMQGVPPTREPVAADDYRQIIDRDQLARGFEVLSLEHRAVIVLKQYLDLPLETVAHILGIPEGTARSRYHRAMGALRAALESDQRLPPPTGTAPVEKMQGVLE